MSRDDGGRIVGVDERQPPRCVGIEQVVVFALHLASATALGRHCTPIPMNHSHHPRIRWSVQAPRHGVVVICYTQADARQKDTNLTGIRENAPLPRPLLTLLRTGLAANHRTHSQHTRFLRYTQCPSCGDEEPLPLTRSGLK